METYKPAYAIKLSAKNFGFEDNKKDCPSLRRILYLNPNKYGNRNARIFYKAGVILCQKKKG